MNQSLNALNFRLLTFLFTLRAASHDFRQLFVHNFVEKWLKKSCQRHEEPRHPEQDFQDSKEHISVDLDLTNAFRTKVVQVFNFDEEKQSAKLYIHRRDEEKHDCSNVSHHDQAANFRRNARPAKLTKPVQDRSDGHNPAEQHN